jgi:hypothetical protein
MKTRVLQYIGSTSGTIFYQVQKKKWWGWIDVGPVHVSKDDAIKLAKEITNFKIEYFSQETAISAGENEKT